jgi:nicotinamide-nucleotide amidase
MINATILTIGDELLIGQVLDSNGAYMARALNRIGIWVRRRLSVGDQWTEIWNALKEEEAQSDLLILTGGLGPTDDDITKPLLAKYFDRPLVVDPESLAHIRYLFEEMIKRPLTERNLRQAEIPEGCTVLPNRRGTAPGMWFERNGKILISLPGVPHEMEGLMTDSVLPLLSSHFQLPYIGHRTLVTVGIGESYLADHIREFESSLPETIRLAYLPGLGALRLRLTARGGPMDSLEPGLTERFSQLKLLVKEWLVIDEDLTLQQLIGRMISQRGGSLSTAESCTGGYIAHLITSVPGSSTYFKGSIVSYANEVKARLLRVDPSILQETGAVSEATVSQMLSGSLQLLGSDYGMATSGIMGPDGGTPEKPVGTAWVAAGNRKDSLRQQFHFRFDRQRNIELTAAAALNLLRKFLLKEGG